MKKIKSLTLAILVSAFMLMQTGCFGSFGLTKEVYKFNSHLGEKWVKELAFVALGLCQVYTVAFVADVVILNSIEFWTGSNPVAMVPGQIETQQIMINGKLYILSASRNQFHLESLDKSVKQDLVFNEYRATWTIIVNNKTTDICTINGNGTVSYNQLDKTTTTLTAETILKMAGNKTLALK